MANGGDGAHLLIPGHHNVQGQEVHDGIGAVVNAGIKNLVVVLW